MVASAFKWTASARLYYKCNLASTFIGIKSLYKITLKLLFWVKNAQVVRVIEIPFNTEQWEPLKKSPAVAWRSCGHH